MSESYSRAWALSWFVGGGVGLAAGRMVLCHWVQELSLAGRFANRTVIVGAGDQGRRSEEHTSELQSLMRNSYAVFGLKKKTAHYHAIGGEYPDVTFASEFPTYS